MKRMARSLLIVAIFLALVSSPVTSKEANFSSVNPTQLKMGQFYSPVVLAAKPPPGSRRLISLILGKWYYLLIIGCGVFYVLKSRE